MIHMTQMIGYYHSYVIGYFKMTKWPTNKNPEIIDLVLYLTNNYILIKYNPWEY